MHAQKIGSHSAYNLYVYHLIFWAHFIYCETIKRLTFSSVFALFAYVNEYGGFKSSKWQTLCFNCTNPDVHRIFSFSHWSQKLVNLFHALRCIRWRHVYLQTVFMTVKVKVNTTTIMNQSRTRQFTIQYLKYTEQWSRKRQHENTCTLANKYFFFKYI